MLTVVTFRIGAQLRHSNFGQNIFFQQADVAENIMLVF